ncbi:hypothetical protein [Mesorhizobium ventifaucium]|uniref:hypothetical protein n=1 Tax=Mesorhizobium ventifaucium TaxID=666020 RepID=UPI0020A6E4B9|nr:hypothetical protein [Mesorhizobium ventifaucium]
MNMIVSFGAQKARALGLVENAKHLREAHARSQGLRWLLGQSRRLSLSLQAGLPAYLRPVPASRYRHGRKEFFISAKWISAGTI